MTWAWKQQDDLRYLILPEWNEHGVVVAFTTRIGGLSSGTFQSLNLGLHVGDQQDLVIANRELVCQSLGFDLKQMVCCEQIHDNRVVVVEKQDAGRGSISHNDSLPGYDAMITDCPGMFLTEFYADCIPIYLFDPEKRVIGLVHSGWKGTALRIAEATISIMRNRFDCQTENIKAFIGPGIGSECYHVDENRRSHVESLFTFHDEVIYSNDGGNRYGWDLQLTNRYIMRQSGIRADNIMSCAICTACNQEWFFSYRGSGGHTGRMAAILGLLD